jgi:glycosyltransferase involved in cell wall biosynthesis
VGATLRHLLAFKSSPLISVLMPVYNAPEAWLRRAVESVRAQLYTRWELCVADDASTQAHVRPLLERYASEDARIKVVFRERNGHISAASNSALALVSGEFVALLDHDDELHESALYHVAAELDAHPDAALIYTDEDSIDESGARLPAHFKPDWNPDLFMSHNFINHLCAYRTQLVREAGGFREGYEGSQDYDLVLRVVERISDSQIRHVPRVLYHWRDIPGSTSHGAGGKAYAAPAAERALASHLKRVGRVGEVSSLEQHRYRIKYRVAREPKVQLIVSAPARGQSSSAPLDHITSKTSYSNYAISVLRSSSNNAHALNDAARETDAQVLLFIDAALSPDDDDWLGEMTSHALRPEIGAVGAKLLDAKDRILHAGLLLGVGARGSACVAGSAFYGMAESHPRAARFGRSLLAQNFSAVAKSCFMIRRELFEESGGFDAANLPRVFYDVDLCLRLGERGLRALYTPFAKLRTRHGASSSSTCAYPPGYGAHARAEVEYMRRRWGALLREDPYYNLNLDPARGDYKLAFPPRLSEVI